jgi:hypothetical protein
MTRWTLNVKENKVNYKYKSMKPTKLWTKKCEPDITIFRNRKKKNECFIIDHSYYDFF